MHKPSECCLGKERKEEQQKTKPAYTANSTIYAIATALMVNPHFQALLATIGTALQGEDKEEWWCKPTRIWAYLLACVAGTSYLDTGQLSHFITYLFIIYLPMFIIFICRSAIQENPASHCFLMATILQGTPWPP
jgi:hypothetical protein